MKPSLRLLPLAVLAVASTAWAQGAQKVAPVEVVATRIPEAPHDVPASIEVVSGASLRARGASTLRDALSLAAGIAVAPGGDMGPAGSVPEIWGLREFDAFLLVVDDIPWGGALNPAVTALSLRDVERIEILRGPAPVTYGATSFVGVIHVVHSAAAAKARYLEAHAGNFGSGGIGLDFGAPALKGWTARASADLDKQGFADDRTGATRGHVLYRTAGQSFLGRTWLTADLNILQQDPASPHAREGKVLSSNTPLDANYNPKGAYLNDNRIAIFGGFQRKGWHGADWTTTASFTHSAQSSFRGFLTSISNTANNASGWKENIDINDFYGDSHLIFPAWNNVRFVLGVDLLAAGGEATGATFNYTAPLAGTSAPSVSEPTNLDKDAGNDRLFMGTYLQAEWRPSSRLNITGGLRGNSTMERRGEGEWARHAKPSGSVGAMYTLWEKDAGHLRAFANFRSTFKPAAFDFSLAENEGVLEPETSTSYEGGIKYRSPSGRTDVEVSSFNMDFNNLVTATVVGGTPALINSGKTRFKGVEIAADFTLANDVALRGTYSAHDGKFVDFIQAFDGVPTQLGGKRFEMSAKKLASAGLVWSPATGLFAHAEMNYTGDRFLNKRNTALAPAFSTYDAGIGYRMDAWEVRLEGRNLGDRRDAVAESEFGDAQYYRMTARSMRLGVAWKY